MIEKKYVTKDGREGSNWKLELGDVFTCLFDEVMERTNVWQGKKITSWSMKCSVGGEERYIQFTGGQSKVLKKEAPLAGKTFRTRPYNTPLGEFVGLSLDKASSSKQLSLKRKNDLKGNEFLPQVVQWLEAREQETDMLVTLSEAGLVKEEAEALIAEAKLRIANPALGTE